MSGLRIRANPEDSASVVIEIGAVFSKCGFAGEHTPRHVMRTQITSRVSGKQITYSKAMSGGEDELESFLHDLFHHMYYKVLLLNPRDRSCAVVESVLSPSNLRRAVAKVLFVKMNVPELCFIPNYPSTLFTVAKTTALVLDFGFEKTVIMPVIENIPMLIEAEILMVGSKAIHDCIEKSLLENSKVMLPSGEVKPCSEFPLLLTSSIIEDIKVRTCFVSPHHRAKELYEKSENFKPAPSVEYPLPDSEILLVVGNCREFSAECLFSFNDDENNLAELILSSVSRCPIDTRKELLSNIIITGGTAHLPGLKHRLMSELRWALDESSLAPKFENNKTVLMHDVPCKPCYVNWLGASIYAQSKSTSLNFIKVKDYKQLNFDATDWCNNRTVD